MSNLYVMRHGRTDWNAEHRIQGRTDILLNEEGKKMAQEAAVSYKDVNFDVCFCSPLTRAKQTAQILLEGRDVPVIIDERLAEMSFGIYEGTANIYDKPECPLRVFFFHPEEYTTAVKDGESIDELFARVSSFIEEKAFPALREDKDVLIMGHGALNSCITCYVKKRPLKEFWAEGIPNCVLQKLI